MITMRFWNLNKWLWLVREDADLDISEGGKTSAMLAGLPPEGTTGGFFTWDNRYRGSKT